MIVGGRSIPSLAHQIWRDPDNAAALVATLSDEQKADCLVAIKQLREEVVAPYYAAENMIENAIGRTLLARRAERGGDAEIAIPHPVLDIHLEAQYAPYVYDVAQLEEALPALDEAERKKLVTIIPEHTQVVPRQVLPGNTASIKAIAKRYAGSAVGKIIEKAMDRPRLADRIVIKPKKGKK